MEGGGCVDEWLGIIWGVNLPFDLLCHLDVQHTEVQKRDRNSRIYRMDH